METDISGNFKNRPSQFLDWVEDRDANESGVKIATAEERPFTIDFRATKGAVEERIWLDHTDRKRLTAERPDYLVVAPGNSLHTDLVELRKENALLRRRIETVEGEDVRLFETKKTLMRKEMDLKRRENLLMQHKPRSIQQALALRHKKYK